MANRPDRASATANRYLQTLSLTFIALLSPIAQADNLSVYIADVDTTSYTDTMKQLRGKHHGGQRAMLLELTRELMQAMDLEPVLEPVSTEQGIATVKTGQLRAVAGVSRNDTNLKWVGPLQVDDIWLFQKSSSNNDYKKISKNALQQTPVCVRKDSGHDKLLQQQGFTQLVIGSSYDDCWNHLLSGEVALASLNQTLVPLILESNEKTAATISNSGVAVQQNTLYIAFSGDTPDATIEQWQGSLDKLQDSRLHDSLIQHYYCQQDCF